MSAARLSEEEKQALVRAYRRGEKIDAICARFGVDRSYPRILARRRGFAPRSPGRPRKEEANGHD